MNFHYHIIVKTFLHISKQLFDHMNLHRSIILFLVFISSQNIFSANISGTVVSKNSKKSLENVHAFLLNEKGLLVQSVKTNEKGGFSFQNIVAGSFKVKLTYLGFQSYESQIFELKEESKNLGKIELEERNNSLKDVLITANKSMKASNIDKKEYTPNQLLNSQNSSAAELINSLPSVNMGNENKNVSVRGDENTTILINGKISSLTGESLSQIPASAIERIEVISNPSAKMNSEGSGGIINIVLKNANANLNSGFVAGSAGTNNKYNAQAGYTFSLNKFSFSTAYSYKYDEYENDGYSFRNYLNQGLINYFNQKTIGETYKRNHFGRLGVEYEIDKYNTINTIGSVSHTWENSFENKNNEILNNLKSATSLWDRNSLKTDLNLIYDASISFVHKSPKNANVLSIEFSNNGNNNIKDENFYQPYQLYNSQTTDSVLKNNIYNFQRRTTSIGQIDYSYQINSKNTLETGLRASVRDFKFTNMYSVFNTTNKVYEPYTALTNDFNFVENLYSTYGVLTSQWTDKLTTKVGMRLEQTNTSSSNFDTAKIYDNNYFNAFPSMILNYKLSPTLGNISFSFSNRINRPGPGMLNPIQDVSDPQSIRYGNPKLNPEIINSFELGYGNDIGKVLSFSTTVYHKRSVNSITRFITINDVGATQVKIDNIGSLINTGWEIIANYKMNKFINFNFNSNLAYNSLTYPSTNKEYVNQYVSWQGRLIGNVKLPANFDIQFITFYKSPMNTPQGKLDFMSNVDITIRKKIFHQRGLITAGITDIFNDQKFKISIDEIDFNSQFVRKKETRIFTIGFRYNFGGEKTKKSKIDKIELPKESQDSGF